MKGASEGPRVAPMTSILVEEYFRMKHEEEERIRFNKEQYRKDHPKQENLK